jgi:hypothetical protein
MITWPFADVVERRKQLFEESEWPVRQMMENYLEQKVDLRHLLIDFKAAYE